ncbi:alpha/beta fold hydrolase [Alkalilimnicola ehrlichii MLHE-1]|uniref:Alpha/beta hydrolase fold protein n=1 Tax=Alkalilimnicola ehrlichii (strain ATCC BAA-1101 / DSM 17681 / MLHE-1) TaxID=187272 RepID=Q0A8J0_ALKEH|nr:alpha/beta hydrolase [Alkalilimnicola ehrlichii]ABI56847.1 alpha/beta hydrolase fold protein [Alkalilimnicola ehrlichii MLHE-1]
MLFETSPANQGEHRCTLVASDGTRLAYQIRPTSGRRRGVLVALHGLSSNMSRWAEFSAQTRLTRNWEIIRTDLRGHGQSLDWRPVDLGRWCRDLLSLLDTEGHQRAVLVGHCLGAAVAAEFARRHPDRVQGLVLVEPLLPEALPARLQRYYRWRGLLRPLLAAAHAAYAVGLHRRRYRSVDLVALDRAARERMAQEGGADVIRKSHGRPLDDMRRMPWALYVEALLATVGLPGDRLAEIGAPTLALLSNGSDLSDCQVTRRYLEAMPRCEVRVLDAHHWLPTERPDDVRIQIEAFCRGLEIEAGEPLEAASADPEASPSQRTRP